MLQGSSNKADSPGVWSWHQPLWGEGVRSPGAGVRVVEDEKGPYGRVCLVSSFHAGTARIHQTSVLKCAWPWIQGPHSSMIHSSSFTPNRNIHIWADYRPSTPVFQVEHVIQHPTQSLGHSRNSTNMSVNLICLINDASDKFYKTSCTWFYKYNEVEFLVRYIWSGLYLCS